MLISRQCGGQGIHTIKFKRPDRGVESKRKREHACRTYGTKKRASRSKKNLKVVAITESDVATDMSGDDDMEVSVDVLGISAQECAKEVMSDVIDKAYSEITCVKPKSEVVCLIGD